MQFEQLKQLRQVQAVGSTGFHNGPRLGSAGLAPSNASAACSERPEESGPGPSAMSLKLQKRLAASILGCGHLAVFLLNVFLDQQTTFG